MTSSLSEKVFVTINGVKQGMFLKSKYDTHPMLLYLHGGMPEYFLTQRYPTGLEEAFTSCSRTCWQEPIGLPTLYNRHLLHVTRVDEPVHIKEVR